MSPKLGLHSAGDRGLLVVVCAVVLIPGDTLAYMPTLSLEQASEPQGHPIFENAFECLNTPLASYRADKPLK
jgi:hypothetical protein